MGVTIPGPEHTIVQVRGNKLVENAIIKTARCDIFPVGRGGLSDNFEIRTNDLIKMSFYTDVIIRRDAGILSVRDSQS
jgi:hypothetical protein